MYTKNPSVIETDLQHELILLHPETGEMFSLNETGRRIWAALPAASVQEVAAMLVASHEVDPETAERDVRAHLDQLCTARLVVETLTSERSS